MTVRWTIRTKLAALVLAVLLPLVAGAAFKFWRDLAQGRADAQGRLLATAEIVARHLDEVLSGQIEDLEALASVRSLDRIHGEDLRTLAARVRVRHPFVHRFLAAGPDGRITASSLSPVAGSGASAVDTGAVAAVLGERAPRVGPPQPSPVGGGLIVPLVVPVLDPKGAPLGVVGADIELQALSVFLGGVRVSPGTSVAVITADGIMLAHSGGARRTLGQRLSTTPSAASLLRGHGGVAEWRWDDDVVSLAGAAPMSVAPWMVVAAMPSGLAYAPAASRLQGNLSGLAAVTLAAVFAAWLISRSMTRSVQSFMKGARGLASGEGPAITVQTGDELAELADRFNLAVAERRRAEAATDLRQRRIQALAEVNLSLSRQLDDEEIRLAQAFADQAALALDNAHLYEETHQRLRHLDSLREVVEQILVPVSLEERLNLIARKTAELFAADRVTIALRDDERGELVVRAGYRMTAGEVGRIVPEGTGALGVAAGRRQGVLVDDYQAWPHSDPFITGAYRTEPPRAVIAYPLLIGDRVIGALSAGIRSPGKMFGPADLDRLASLAVPAALAIEHSRLYEEMAARLRELQDAQAQVVQAGKLSAVGQLVSGVAHELNNPLSVVIGYGQLLKSRELPADIRRPVELILAQGKRMARIVQNLLLFSRQRTPWQGAVDVGGVMDQTISLRATQLMLSGIRVETVYGDDVPAAEGDAHQLRQVFLNLLLNAEQAILGSGVGEHRVGDCIQISTTARVENGKTWVVIRVADNGPGIPADILPRIFEPFFTTKKVGEGTGLGLSVSYGIIQQHGGRLTAESQPGRTAFTLELSAMTRARPLGPQPSDMTAVGAGSARHALVVDDEPSVVELVTTLLRQAGWDVDVATGGRAALERLRRARYDLVVSDLRMPDGSGEALFHAATAERRDLTARFLFMTGDTANPAAWEFLEDSRAHVLEKPFTARALLRAIDRATA